MGEQDTPTFDARFIPSDWLRNLRQRRKQVRDNATRKSLTFEIRRLHRKEFKQWKAALLRKYLAHPARRKELQNMSSYTSKPLHQHPPLDEFAMMLERLFFFPTPFFRNKVSQSCFTGQLPGIGTVFILANLQMCKVQRQSPRQIKDDEGGGGWGLLGWGGIVRGGR